MISAFITIGSEHSAVNMFMLALSLGLPANMVMLPVSMLCRFMAVFIAAAVVRSSVACTSVLPSFELLLLQHPPVQQ